MLQLETVHLSVLKAVRIKPEQQFVGLFSRVKDELVNSNLLTYKGNFIYALTDLGLAMLGCAV